MSTANIAETSEFEHKYKVLTDQMLAVQKAENKSFEQTMGCVFTEEIPICGAFMAGIGGIGWTLKKTGLPSKAKSAWAASSFTKSWPLFHFDKKLYNDVYARNKSAAESKKAFLNKLKDPNSRGQTLKNKTNYKIVKSFEVPPEIKGSVRNLTGEVYQSARKLQTRINNGEFMGKELEKQQKRLQKLITKSQNKQLISQQYDKARRILSRIERGDLKGEALKQAKKEFFEALRQGDIEVNKLREAGQIKATSKFGKVKHWIKKKTGAYKLKGKILNARSGSKVLRYASKGLKGNALFAVIASIIEIPKIIAANKIDKANKAQGKSSDHCKKQIKKSVIKTVASVGGYAAGSALATAAVGAACGSVVPVVGNIVGFVGGLIVGAIAGHVANKLTNCDTDETEVAKDKQSSDVAKEAANNEEVGDEVLSQAVDAINNGDVNDENFIKTANELLESRKDKSTDETIQHAGYTNYAKNDMLSNVTDYSKELTQLAYLKTIMNKNANPFVGTNFNYNF